MQKNETNKLYIYTHMYVCIYIHIYICPSQESGNMCVFVLMFGFFSPEVFNSNFTPGRLAELTGCEGLSFHAIGQEAKYLRQRLSL